MKTLKRLEDRFGIPYATLYQWSKAKNGWRKELINTLFVFLEAEEEAEEKFGEIFDKREAELIKDFLKQEAPLAEIKAFCERLEAFALQKEFDPFYYIDAKSICQKIQNAGAIEMSVIFDRFLKEN